MSNNENDSFCIRGYGGNLNVHKRLDTLGKSILKVMYGKRMTSSGSRIYEIFQKLSYQVSTRMKYPLNWNTTNIAVEENGIIMIEKKVQKNWPILLLQEFIYYLHRKSIDEYKNSRKKSKHGL